MKPIRAPFSPPLSVLHWADLFFWLGVSMLETFSDFTGSHGNHHCEQYFATTSERIRSVGKQQPELLGGQLQQLWIPQVTETDELLQQKLLQNLSQAQGDARYCSDPFDIF